MVKSNSNPTVKKVSAKAPASSRKKKATKKTGSANRKPTYSWDVVNAEKDYLSDSQASYESIAKKYNTSKRNVERYATKHEWVKRRQNVVENGTKKFEDKQAELISETNEEHLRIYKNARNIAYNNLVKVSKQAGDNGIIDVKELNGNISAIGDAIRGERTVLGLPTLIQSFGNPKDDKQEEMTWAGILASVNEARKKGLVDNAGSSTEGH